MDKNKLCLLITIFSFFFSIGVGATADDSSGWISLYDNSGFGNKVHLEFHPEKESIRFTFDKPKIQNKKEVLNFFLRIFSFSG